jgi:hypothetical protein
MEIRQTYCRQCDTTIEGHFELGRFNKLTPEQLAFAELFIRCEGKINKVGEETNASYHAVRNKLNELIRALGYEIADEPPLSADERRAILDQLASGAITSEEAIRLLKDK